MSFCSYNINDHYLNHLIDVAMIKINPPLNLTDKVQMIRINDVESNLIGCKTTISGWGRTESGSTNHLKKAEYKITSMHEGLVDFLTSETGPSVGRGDSGGSICNPPYYLLCYKIMCTSSNLHTKDSSLK